MTVWILILCVSVVCMAMRLGAIVFHPSRLDGRLNSAADAAVPAMLVAFLLILAAQHVTTQRDVAAPAVALVLAGVLTRLGAPLLAVLVSAAAAAALLRAVV